MPLQMSANSWQQQGPGFGVLKDLTVNRLSEADQLGPHYILGQTGSVWQAVQVLVRRRSSVIW